MVFGHAALYGVAVFIAVSALCDGGGGPHQIAPTALGEKVYGGAHAVGVLGGDGDDGGGDHLSVVNVFA